MLPTNGEETREGALNTMAGGGALYTIRRHFMHVIRDQSEALNLYIYISQIDGGWWWEPHNTTRYATLRYSTVQYVGIL